MVYNGSCNRVVSMLLAALPLMADVKVEGVVAENKSGSGVELSSARRNAYELPQIPIKSACIV